MRKRMQGILSICMAVLMLVCCGFAQAETPSLKDDFYEAINTDWYTAAEIPSDKPVVGGFTDLDDGVRELLMADFAAMLNGGKEPGNAEMSSFIEYYRLAADFEARDTAGAQPLLPYMERIEKLNSLEDLANQWAEWDMAGMPSPFSAFVMADMEDATNNVLYMTPPGLFLLDKSYYQDEATKAMLQSAYGQMSINLLVMAGKSEEEATAIVQDALAFDESLAPYMQSAEEASDYTTLYNPADFAEFDAEIKGFDFTAAFHEILGVTPDTIILTNPEYFAALDELVSEETFQVMRSWQLVIMVNSLSSYLSDDFRLEAGSFSRMIYGTSEATAKEKSAYSLATGMFSEVSGIYYGQTYFGEEAKQDVASMVETMISVYKSRISQNAWLGDETRASAIKKLDNMTINVGYPDEARPLYSQFKTVPASEGGTLVGNSMEFSYLSKLDNYSDWNQPVDRGLWPLSADTVNAMYSPLNNSINFPAAILQAPFYSLEQSSSANYGGIGAVIAHEISHAFDPNGAKFDELGNLANWWTDQDYATFEQLSQAMVAEFDGIELAGGTVNGSLTVTENVADAGGLACALEAAKLEEDVNLEAFFTNWAVIWRQKATPEYEALLLNIDSHAPSKLRANIQLQNMDDFFTTFDIREGDGMYRAPEDRVTIW